MPLATQEPSCRQTATTPRPAVLSSMSWCSCWRTAPSTPCLGWLYPGRPDFDGLTGREANPWHRPDGTVSVPVWSDLGLSRSRASGPDPRSRRAVQRHGAAVLRRLGHDAGRAGAWAPDDGRFRPTTTCASLADRTMRNPIRRLSCIVTTPTQLPVLSELARSFGVSDRWFASAPCQTWPNRFFAHTGTAGGWVNNDPPHFPLPDAEPVPPHDRARRGLGGLFP